MKQFIVYIHINKINKKCYVGITSQTPEARWKPNGLGYCTQEKFYNAIKKYGWENFEHKIIYEGLSQEEACKAEQVLIEQYDSINNGYNSTLGGSGCLGHNVSEEARKKISEARKKYRGYKRPPEVGQKISQKLKGKYTGRPAWNKGTHVSEEERLKIRQRAKEAALKTIAKQVRCIETNITYESLTAAFEATGINICNICGCASGKRKTAGKLHWEYV